MEMKVEYIEDQSDPESDDLQLAFIFEGGSILLEFDDEDVVALLHILDSYVRSEDIDLDDDDEFEFIGIDWSRSADRDIVETLESADPDEIEEFMVEHCIDNLSEDEKRKLALDSLLSGGQRVSKGRRRKR